MVFERSLRRLRGARARVARALIARVERHAHETGAKGLLVEIPFSEPKLIELYESAGYRKDAGFDVYRLGVAAPA